MRYDFPRADFVNCSFSFNDFNNNRHDNGVIFGKLLEKGGQQKAAEAADGDRVRAQDIAVGTEVSCLCCQLIILLC